LEACPEMMPDIALKIEENRGIDHGESWNSFIDWMTLTA
jgi:hypothetical protein